MTNPAAIRAKSDIEAAIEKLRIYHVQPDTRNNYWFHAHPVAINGLFGLHRFKARRKSARVAMFAAMDRQFAENAARYKAGL